MGRQGNGGRGGTDWGKGRGGGNFRRVGNSQEWREGRGGGWGGGGGVKL